MNANEQAIAYFVALNCRGNTKCATAQMARALRDKHGGIAAEPLGGQNFRPETSGPDANFNPRQIQWLAWRGRGGKSMTPKRRGHCAHAAYLTANFCFETDLSFKKTSTW